MSQGEGGGRPTKYKAAFCKQAKALSKLGATDLELAQFFEISVFTLNRWKLEYPKFSASIKLGKAPSDKRVELSLFNRARGYTYEAEELFPYDHIEERAGPTPESPKIVVREKRVLRVPVLKHVPPDPTSMIFWLKNRRKDRWRDFKATEISTPPGRPMEVRTYTPGEPRLLEDYYAKIAQSAAAADPDPEPHRPLGSTGSEWEEPGDGEDVSPR